MAALLFVFGLAGAGGLLTNAYIQNRRKREAFEIAAAAFSALFGVRIVCEEEAKTEIEKGNPNVKKLEIKDIFKIKPKDFNENRPPLYYIPDSAYDPQYDCDFTNHFASLERCTRGDYPYKRPSGWKRKAVKVLGKYEDDVWLGKDGWRSESSPGEWPVSYHGTKIQNVRNIVTEGYDTRKCVRARFGKGIYSTPSFDVAQQYATEFNYKGENYKCILQNRVNLKKTKIIDVKFHGDAYLLTPNADDIRPYGVCIKKV